MIALAEVLLDTLCTGGCNSPEEQCDRRDCTEPTLDSVRVVAERPELPSFEEHQRLGLGTFITRAQLEKQEGKKYLFGADDVEITDGQAVKAFTKLPRHRPRKAKVATVINIPIMLTAS